MSISWRCKQRRTSRSHMRRTRGQALVLIALMLPVLTAFVFTAVELGTRMLQRAEVEDALRNATRVAVQTWAYESFAADAVAVRPVDVIAVGRHALVINLDGVPGLQLALEQAAAEVSWVPITDPARDTCTDPQGRTITFATPGVCATLKVPLEGLATQPWWRMAQRGSACPLLPCLLPCRHHPCHQCRPSRTIHLGGRQQQAT